MEPSRFCHLSVFGRRSYILRRCKVKKSVGSNLSDASLSRGPVVFDVLAEARRAVAVYVCLSIFSLTDREMTPATLFGVISLLFYSFWHCCPERVWVISIARLWTLPPLHLQPIDVIVFDDPYVEILS